MADKLDCFLTVYYRRHEIVSTRCSDNFTSAKEVMFSCEFICLYVCLLTESVKKGIGAPLDIHEIFPRCCYSLMKELITLKMLPYISSQTFK